MYPKYILIGEITYKEESTPELVVNRRETFPLESDSLVFVTYLRQFRTSEQITEWLRAEGSLEDPLHWTEVLLASPSMLCFPRVDDWTPFAKVSVRKTATYDPAQYPVINQVMTFPLPSPESLANDEDIESPFEGRFEGYLDELDRGIAQGDLLLRMRNNERTSPRRSFP